MNPYLLWAKMNHETIKQCGRSPDLQRICSDPQELDTYDSSCTISPGKGKHTVTKRRTFKPDFKARVVLEELTGVKSTAEICRDHQLKPQVFSRWKAELLERAPEIFATRPSRGDEQERIAELERMVGRLTMELETAKKASSILTSHLSRNGR